LYQPFINSTILFISNIVLLSVHNNKFEKIILVIDLSVFDKILRRSPREIAKRSIRSAKELKSKGDNEQASQHLIKAAEAFVSIDDQQKATKLFIESGDLLTELSDFQNAGDCYNKAAHIYISNLMYEKASNLYSLTAKSRAYVKDWSGYRLAVLLSTLSLLVREKRNEAFEIPGRLAKELDVKVKLKQAGEILDTIFDSLRYHRLNKQRIQRTKKLLKGLNLDKDESKLALGVLKLVEHRANTHIHIATSFLQVIVGSEVQIRGTLRSPTKVGISEYKLHLTPQFQLVNIDPQPGVFQIKIKAIKQGSGIVGPLDLTLIDPEKRRFLMSSNQLELTIEEATINLQIGINPINLPVNKETEVQLKVKNSGSNAINDLNIEFSFSRNLKVVLGTLQKKLQILRPQETFIFPLTVKMRKEQKTTAKVKYSFQDIHGVKHEKIGKTILYPKMTS
jgi:tetratricopeptide (TPR) repeat protein